jgi:hypothetical protein
MAWIGTVAVCAGRVGGRLGATAAILRSGLHPAARILWDPAWRIFNLAAGTIQDPLLSRPGTLSAATLERPHWPTCFRGGVGRRREARSCMNRARCEHAYSYAVPHTTSGPEGWLTHHRRTHPDAPHAGSTLELRIVRGAIAGISRPASRLPGCAPAPASLAALGAPRRAGPQVPVLDWVPCHGAFQCATARVPLDYRHPDGAKISIAVIGTGPPARAAASARCSKTAADPARRSTAWQPATWGSPPRCGPPTTSSPLTPRGFGGSASIQCFRTRAAENHLLACRTAPAWAPSTPACSRARPGTWCWTAT